MSDICRKSFKEGDFDKCHADLRDKAIARYEAQGPFGLPNLFMKKLYHQAGQQNYFYNAEQSIVGYAGSRTSSLMSNAMFVYATVLFIFSARFLFVSARSAMQTGRIEPALIQTTLLLIGWFFSFMIVESAPRYSTILYPLFTVFAVLNSRPRNHAGIVVERHSASALKRRSS